MLDINKLLQSICEFGEIEEIIVKCCYFHMFLANVKAMSLPADSVLRLWVDG